MYEHRGRNMRALIAAAVANPHSTTSLASPAPALAEKQAFTECQLIYMRRLELSARFDAAAEAARRLQEIVDDLEEQIARDQTDAAITFLEILATLGFLAFRAWRAYRKYNRLLHKDGGLSLSEAVVTILGFDLGADLINTLRRIYRDQAQLEEIVQRQAEAEDAKRRLVEDLQGYDRLWRENDCGPMLQAPRLPNS